MPILYDTQSLTDYIKEHKLPSFRTKQIQQAIFKESLLEIDEITTLSKELRDQLKKDDFAINTLILDKVVE